MNRLTFGMVKGKVARLLNMCEDNPLVLDYVNRAQERLLYEGKHVGTYARYRVCTSNACITLPRQLETIEAFSIDDSPGTIRSAWFEFLGTGPGQFTSCTTSCLDAQAVDRGEACAFDDVTGTGKVLAVFCGLPEAANQVVNLQFYDENMNWVRTSYGGEWIDGENVTLPTGGGYVYTTNTCHAEGLVRVRKPATNGPLRLFDYSAAAGYHALGYYEADELIPVYRRYYIPSLEACVSETGCTTRTLVIMGKLRHIDAVTDLSYLQVSFIEALLMACKSVQKWDADRDDEARSNLLEAVRLLDRQLKHYKGDGEVQPIRITADNVTGPTVENIV